MHFVQDARHRDREVYWEVRGLSLSVRGRGGQRGPSLMHFQSLSIIRQSPIDLLTLSPGVWTWQTRTKLLDRELTLENSEMAKSSQLIGD